MRKVFTNLAISIIVVLTIGIVGKQLIDGRNRAAIQSEAMSKKTTDPLAAYLDTIDTTRFSNDQRALLAVLRQEYAKKPRGYDKNVLKYSEGFRESWCADFISWSFQAIGQPFVHPDTGYWRIPGVQTLMAYYRSFDVYHAVSSDYKPQFGDVAFYFGETPDGSSTEHVAIILGLHEGKLYTLGGNEGDGIMRIRADTYKAGEKGLSGIGESKLGA